MERQHKRAIFYTPTKDSSKKVPTGSLYDNTSSILRKRFIFSSHLNNIISDPTKGIQSFLKHLCAFSTFTSPVELKNIKEGIKESEWIIAMQSELHEFERNKVWELVERPQDHTIIGTR